MVLAASQGAGVELMNIPIPEGNAQEQEMGDSGKEVVEIYHLHPP